MAQSDPPVLTIDKGICYALFAYDVGLAIDLDEADRRIKASKERGRIKHKPKAPHFLEYRPAPLRVIQEGTPLTIGKYVSTASVDVMLYDFGALSVTYKIPLAGSFSELLTLSEDLFENPVLLADSRTRVDQLLAALQETVDRPHVFSSVEDYVIFEVETYRGSTSNPVWITHPHELAQILRSDRALLSEQEVRDATSYRISYGPEDAAMVDWNGALLFGPNMEDVRAVLEFANVELLEMRILDRQLDDALDQAYEALSKKLWARLRLPGSFETDSARIAQMQVDSAIIFERVTNTLKLLGDQYLARVYRLASQRFYLEAWDASISRKLQTLESIYGKITDRVESRRLEILEWIIIILIAVSIAVSFLPGLESH